MSFCNAWALNAWLFRGVHDPDAMRLSPDPLRNPLIFYLGHTAAFYLNKLVAAGVLARGVDERLERLFARGVDPATADELEARAWPALDRVWAWRADVFELVNGVIERLPIRLPVTDRDPVWALLMGVEHARIHFETSSVLIRQAPLRALRAPEGWRCAPSWGRPEAMRRVRIDAGAVTLGKPSRTPWFGWDNEYGRSERRVGSFEIADRLVANADYLTFVQEGGYDRRELWTEEGWRWRVAEGARRPRFWREIGGEVWLRTVFDERPLPLDWPAEVNGLEAAAWCRWAGARLPSEAELALATDDAPLTHDDVIEDPAYNLNLRWQSPRPVGAGVPTPRGLHDAWGNVWQWLSDDFAPLPGFAPHPLYDDFSSPYFDADHSGLRGGAWATTGTGASRYYRLWFRRHFYQHAGFRPVWELA